MTASKSDLYRKLSLNTLLAYVSSVLLALFCFTGSASAQTYAQCKEAGGTEADCVEPHVGAWKDYSIWGATGLPNGVCQQYFTTENAAVTCVQSGVSTNIGSAYPSWCAIEWHLGASEPIIISPADWTTYSQYHGWNTAEWRQAATFNWTYHLYQSSQCVPHTQTGYIQVVRVRSVLCPPGYSYWVPRPDGKHVCWKQSVADDHDSCSRPTAGNPVRITDRVKIQTEFDYQSAATPHLQLQRRYSSENRTNLAVPPLGAGSRWTGYYERRLIRNTLVSPPVVTVWDADGSVSAFRKQSAQWQPTANSTGRLIEFVDGGGATTGWVFRSRSNDLQSFDRLGRLVTLSSAQGLFVSLTYGSGGGLDRVADPFGRALVFAPIIDAATGYKYRETVTDPAGRTVQYFWDGASAVSVPGPQATPFDLTSVTYQDGTRRTLYYSEPERIVIPAGVSGAWTPNLLTGTTDENGVRFSLFTYDYDSRVLRTELAGAINRYAFNPVSGQEAVAVTDPLNTTKTYSIFRGRVSRVAQPAGSGSSACAQSLAFDSVTGLVAERQEFNGRLTCFQYESSRRLLSRRLEGQAGPTAYGYCVDASFNSPPLGAE